jgi:hypothetical protein
MLHRWTTDLFEFDLSTTSYLLSGAAMFLIVRFSDMKP